MTIFLTLVALVSIIVWAYNKYNNVELLVKKALDVNKDNVINAADAKAFVTNAEKAVKVAANQTEAVVTKAAAETKEVAQKITTTVKKARKPRKPRNKNVSKE